MTEVPRLGKRAASTPTKPASVNATTAPSTETVAVETRADHSSAGSRGRRVPIERRRSNAAQGTTAATSTGNRASVQAGPFSHPSRTNVGGRNAWRETDQRRERSEEHTSELQSRE